jgi:hypothetical protein
MHPLLKRILWHGIPVAVVLGALGYFLGAALEMAAKNYNAELSGNQAPTQRGLLLFGGLGFIAVAGMEALRWRREQKTEAPPKADAVPPKSPPSPNGL